MKATSQHLGAYLREAMQAAAVRPVDVARALPVNPSTVSRWLSGQRQPTRDELECLADLLAVDLADLLELSGRTVQADRRRQREEAEGDVWVALRRDLARICMRPGARGAMLRLAQELAMGPPSLPPPPPPPPPPAPAPVIVDHESPAVAWMEREHVGG